MASPTMKAILNPDIDKFLSPYVPPNPVHHFPRPVSHFLGHRSKAAHEPPIIVQWALLFLATIAGICVVGAVYNFAPGITQWNPPTIVASLGASAVLDYNTIKSPLAQPRNALVGHTISAIVGTGIAKAFQLSPAFFAQYDWVAAAIACATASLAMSMTNTVHPPGGATAIIACTEKSVIAMGWTFPPLIIVACLLMLGVALLFNNTLRQYPVFWWTPEDVGQKLPSWPRRKDASSGHDFEGKELSDSDADHISDIETGRVAAGRTYSEHEEPDDLRSQFQHVGVFHGLHVLPDNIQVPTEIQLSEEEMEVLVELQRRIKEHG